MARTNMVAILIDAEQYTVKKVLFFGVYGGLGKCVLGSDSPADPRVCPQVVGGSHPVKPHSYA